MKTIHTLGLAIAIAIGAGSMSPQAAATGIPTFDIANLIEAQKSFMEMTKQLNELQAATAELQSQTQAMTGNRGLGMLNYENYLATIPRNWRETLAGGKVSGLAKSIADKASLLDKKDFKGLTESVRKSLEESMNDTANAQALNAQIFDNSGNRFQRLQGLMAQINQATDLKAINDLQARIQIENGLLQNEAIKLQAMNAVLAQQERLKGQTEGQRLMLMTQQKY